MASEFSHLDNEEQLKAENDFMKMKLMLEKGAQFGAMSDQELPAEIENDFLKHIMEFEEQAANAAMTTVFDRLNKPGHFRPVEQIDDDEIEKAWEALSIYMEERGIRLDVCSPNVSIRELYRFTTEELFKTEMNDFNIPGMMSCFIYDEFHPDPVYDTSRMVEQDLFKNIFSEHVFCELWLANDGFEFNGRSFTEREDFVKQIDLFKSLFDRLELINCMIEQCVVGEGVSEIKGSYSAKGIAGTEVTTFQGNFETRLCRDECGYWVFKEIKMKGFDLQ